MEKLGHVVPRECDVASSFFSWPILRDARKCAPQDEVIASGGTPDPHGEERGTPRVSKHEAGQPSRCWVAVILVRVRVAQGADDGE
jgi:hypothetical protein